MLRIYYMCEEYILNLKNDWGVLAANDIETFIRH